MIIGKKKKRINDGRTRNGFQNVNDHENFNLRTTHAHTTRRSDGRCATLGHARTHTTTLLQRF